MVEHWRNIGFAPTEFTLDEDLDTENDVQIKDTGKFTPQKNELTDEETARFTGIILKNLPIALSDKDINEVLNEAGASTTRNIQIHRPEGALKASAEINDLDSLECKKIIDYFQGKVIHGNKVFCRGSSDLHTPNKNEKEDGSKDSEIESSASNPISKDSTPTQSKIKEDLNKSNTKEQAQMTLNIEGQSPAKTPVQTIPGLPSEALALTKKKVKKELKIKVCQELPAV